MGATIAEAEVTDCGGPAVIPGRVGGQRHTTRAALSQTADIGFVDLLAGCDTGADRFRARVQARQGLPRILAGGGVSAH
ncbi:MAG TPA: hypothetical protein VGC31_05060 [Paenirhodobacter sp.]